MGKVLEFAISPRSFKRKTPEEVNVLISEQVMTQMIEFGFNITKDDLLKAKVEVKKPAEKKPEEKKPAEKKPEEKKPAEKKPEEAPGTSVSIVQVHDEVVNLVHANMPAGSFSKFNVQYIKPDDKKVLEFNISPRAFKRKTPEEINELISEQVVTQLNEFGMNITKEDLLQPRVEAKKPEEKKPEEKKPEAKKPEEKKPAEKKPEEKKPAAKKPEEKKPAAKKPEEKKPAEKKPE